MALKTLEKQEIIKKFATKEGDTGSPEVQIALLTTEINNLTQHLKINKHDFHAKRGLLIMVSTRRKLLSYLKDISVERYANLIKKLNLRK